MKNLFTFFFALLVSLPAHAQYGQLDSTFGVNGFSKFGLQQTASHFVSELGIQSTGKILTACVNHGAVNEIELYRLNVDGSFDSTFSVTANLDAYSTTYTNLSVQSDDKILLSGKSNFNDGGLLARYNPDGDIDTSFADNGFCDLSTFGPLVQWSMYAIMKSILLPSGSIILMDDVPHLIKLRADGSIDQSFGNNGNLFFMAPFEGLYSITGDSLGNIYTLGFSQSANEIYIAKLDSSGNLDPSFGVSGIASNSSPFAGYSYSFAQKKNGKFVASGTTFSAIDRTFCLQFDSNGSLETTFGVNGAVVIPDCNPTMTWGNTSMDVQNDDKIILGSVALSPNPPAANHFNIEVIRLNDDGTLDNTFGTFCPGISIAGDTLGQNVIATKLQADGKILIGGSAGILSPGNPNPTPALSVTRFTSDYNPINSLEEQSIMNAVNHFPNPASQTITIENTDGNLHLTTYSIYSVSSQFISAGKLSGDFNRLDISKLQSGIYFLNLIAEDGKTIYRRFVKM